MTTKKEKTRECILNASYALFAKNGFRKVTMKDVCEATGMSRGGLYSHFPGTKEIFEAILEKFNQKNELSFYKEMNEGVSAVRILDGALELLQDEMQHAEDSLSLAMYEYADSVDSDFMEKMNRIGEKKWKDLIMYGIERKEFKEVDTEELVSIILYSYQGIRMWSRIVSITPEICESITSHIRKQLVKELNNYEIYD